MSLADTIKKAKAEVRQNVQEWLTCKDPKRKRTLYRDIADGYKLIQRAEHWLASTNTGGDNDLENQSRDG